MNDTIFFEGSQSLGNRKAFLIPRSILVIIGLMFLVIPGLLLLVYYYLSIVTTKYKITNTKILTESGILSKKINTLELWRVNDIQFKQSFLQRLMGEAQVILITQDVSNPVVKIEGITDSSGLRLLFEKLQPAVNQSRKDNRTVTISS